MITASDERINLLIEKLTDHQISQGLWHLCLCDGIPRCSNLQTYWSAADVVTFLHPLVLRNIVADTTTSTTPPFLNPEP